MNIGTQAKQHQTESKSGKTGGEYLSPTTTTTGDIMALQLSASQQLAAKFKRLNCFFQPPLHREVSRGHQSLQAIKRAQHPHPAKERNSLKRKLFCMSKDGTCRQQGLL